MDNTSTLILGIALSIIMIGMGLSLTTADFKRVLKFPLAVFMGFLNQIILLPILAYALIKLFGVESNTAIGIMILSACPGGPTSNLVTHLAKGDTALSVTLTAINSIVTIFTIPLIVTFAVQEFGIDQGSFVPPTKDIIKLLIAVIAIPLTIGMLLKKYKSAFADKMDKPVRILSSVIIVAVIVGLVIKEREHLVEYISNTFFIAISLNITTMLVGLLTALIVKLKFKQALTICLESGNQNGTLAIGIAGALGNPAYAIPGAVYSLFMYFTALVPIIIGNKKNE
jgi:BASS family bile acid:Na+ symporter